MLFSQVGRQTHTNMYSCHLSYRPTSEEIFRFFSPDCPVSIVFVLRIHYVQVEPPSTEQIGKTIDCIVGIPGLRTSPTQHLAISFFQQLPGLSWLVAIFL